MRYRTVDGCDANHTRPPIQPRGQPHFSCARGRDWLAGRVGREEHLCVFVRSVAGRGVGWGARFLSYSAFIHSHITDNVSIGRSLCSRVCVALQSLGRGEQAGRQ